MAGFEGTPSSLELENAIKVKNMLVDIKGIQIEELRGDIFKVSFKGFSLIVDVEETIVAIMMDVCNLPEEEILDLYKLLLSLNSESVHGKFSIVAGSKIVMQDNLEIENLDMNELESAISWIFAIVTKNIKKILKLSDPSFEDSDLDDDEGFEGFEDDVFFLEEMDVAAGIVIDMIDNHAQEVFENQVDEEAVAVEEEVKQPSYSPEPSYSQESDTTSYGSSDNSCDSGGCDCGCD